MKTSELQPTAWRYGANDPKINILMRRWSGIRKNVAHMEDALLKLMQNPQTTPDQMAMAAKLYANTTQMLNDAATAIDAYLYHGTKPKSQPYNCAFCGSTEPPVEVEGAYPHCPVCKGV